MNRKYVEAPEAKWARSPTEASAGLLVEIRALKDGRAPIDGGQGAELELNPRDSENDAAVLTALTNGGIILETGSYHTVPGGSLTVSQKEMMSTKEKTAGYMRDIWRLPANTQNTHLLAGLGRSLCDLSYHQMAFEHLENRTENYKPILGIAEEHWGTLSALAKDQHLAIKTFDNRNPNPDDAILAFLDSHNPRHIAGLSLTYPLNPTSQEISAEQMSRVFQRVSDLNRQDGVDIHILCDMPYAFACDTAQDSRGTYLKTGLENTLDDIDNVHYMIAFSTSKLLSMSKTGQSILTVDAKRAQKIADRLCNNGHGLARTDALSANIAELLGGGKQDVLWGRKALLKEKYAQNDRPLESAFGEGLVPGGNGMLKLIEVNASEIFNRVVTCCDGQNRVLRDGKDVATFLANEFDAAVVPFGERDGKLRIRVAKRENPDKFSTLVENVNKGMEYIQSSPRLDLAA